MNDIKIIHLNLTSSSYKQNKQQHEQQNEYKNQKQQQQLKRWIENVEIPKKWNEYNNNEKVEIMKEGKLFVKEINMEINRKISSYHQQDKKKKRFINHQNYITNQHVINKYIQQNGLCMYCKLEMKLLYEYCYDEMQWTIDRINNIESHHTENCVLCCLHCNLQKRRRCAIKFSEGKYIEQSIILRENYISDLEHIV